MYPRCNPIGPILLAMSDESCVIRIYRKEASAGVDPGTRRRTDRIALAGMVEFVEGGTRRPFHDIEELWTILTGSRNTVGGTDKSG